MNLPKRAGKKECRSDCDSSRIVPSLSCSQFSQGKEPSTLSVAELTENFARNHERRMAQKVRGMGL